VTEAAFLAPTSLLLGEDKARRLTRQTPGGGGVICVVVIACARRGDVSVCRNGRWT